MYDNRVVLGYVFFFNETATTEIYPLPLHDALPIYRAPDVQSPEHGQPEDGGHPEVDGANPAASRQRSPNDPGAEQRTAAETGDRKSTRLNSSHANISYAVFCLKKKKTT